LSKDLRWRNYQLIIGILKKLVINRVFQKIPFDVLDFVLCGIKKPFPKLLKHQFPLVSFLV